MLASAAERQQSFCKQMWINFSSFLSFLPSSYLFASLFPCSLPHLKDSLYLLPSPLLYISIYIIGSKRAKRKKRKEKSNTQATVSDHSNMGTRLWSEKLSVNRKKIVKELVQGKKFADQLQVLLQKGFEADGSASAEDLVVKILRSFTQTLSVLSSCDDDQVSDDQNLLQQAASCNVSSFSDDRKSEDSGHSMKRPMTKDRRGCYKRKKNLHTWTIISSTMEDGHAWRKYGQKEILNAKYPRSYFRCTHKYDQGCRATKQVQRINDDPQKFETTYISNHTCRDIISFPQIITGSSDRWGGTVSTDSYVISTPTEVKQECKEETTSDDLSDNLSSLDHMMWEDFMSFQSSEPSPMVSLQIGSREYSEMGDFGQEFNFDESHEFF